MQTWEEPFFWKSCSSGRAVLPEELLLRKNCSSIIKIMFIIYTSVLLVETCTVCKEKKCSPNFFWTVFPLDLKSCLSLNLSKIWPRYGQNKKSYETVKIWKIHWKLKYSESRYCFANISATEARIFMKFYVVVNYYLVSLCFKFREDPCISARARVVNARAHVLSRVRACSTFAHAFFHGSPWNLRLKLTI